VKKGNCWLGYAQRWHKKDWRLEDRRIYHREHEGHGENKGKDEG
jgi:hypothetical protein